MITEEYLAVLPENKKMPRVQATHCFSSFGSIWVRQATIWVTNAQKYQKLLQKDVIDIIVQTEVKL